MHLNSRELRKKGYLNYYWNTLSNTSYDSTGSAPERERKSIPVHNDRVFSLVFPGEHA